jgi:hypothetical protein
VTVPRAIRAEHEAQTKSPSGPSHLRLVSITRMGINAPEPINPRTDRFQKQMVATGDSFLGVRFLSAKSARTIGAQRYLGCTVRTQGFSPSLRFSPVLAWWLCFTPHPPLGFRSSELFPRRQPRYLSIFVALLSSRQCPSDSSKLESPVHPYTLSLDAPPVRVVWCRVSVAHLCRTSEHHPYRPSSASWIIGWGEWSVTHRGLTRGMDPVHASPSRGAWQRLRVSQDVDFRALIQRRVRSRHTSITS